MMRFSKVMICGCKQATDKGGSGGEGGVSKGPGPMATFDACIVYLQLQMNLRYNGVPL